MSMVLESWWYVRKNIREVNQAHQGVEPLLQVHLHHDEQSHQGVEPLPQVQLHYGEQAHQGGESLSHVQIHHGERALSKLQSLEHATPVFSRGTCAAFEFNSILPQRLLHFAVHVLQQHDVQQPTLNV